MKQATAKKAKTTLKPATKARKAVSKPKLQIVEINVPMQPKLEQATLKQYLSLQDAFDYYNTHLFAGMLPPVLVTFQRQKKSYGYYWPNKLVNRVDGSKMGEIALAINTFDGLSDEHIFSTLAHEMAHHWQQIFGKPSRNGYHNKEWAAKMKEIGLMPSTTGREGGDETGQAVSHYVMPHGNFAHHTVNLVASIDWNSAPEDKAKKKKANKVKYSCPCCDANAWGKPDLHIVCGEHEEQMMPAEEGE